MGLALASSDDEELRPPRGRVGVHLVAVAVLLASTYALVRGNFSASLELVWWSLGLSGLSILLAVAALVIPRRGARRTRRMRRPKAAEATRPLARPWEER